MNRRSRARGLPATLVATTTLAAAALSGCHFDDCRVAQYDIPTLGTITAKACPDGPAIIHYFDPNTGALIATSDNSAGSCAGPTWTFADGGVHPPPPGC